MKRSVVKASPLEQREEIIANSFSKPIIMPHPGYLSTKYSSYHPAVDIATGLGMPIHPIIDGEISQVGRDFFGLGNFVEVSHENGFKSKYAHMGNVYVQRGQKITSENTLGEVGLTGRTSGPHTHLEVTLNGNYVDPMALLPEIPETPVVLAKNNYFANQ
ncbi:MAG: M23 family metallopeptidase [Candidatus Daviesbacteria bacterium]|nr:M23 family metallopeptidase [Candidatus Daviesbacteria bacterium]